MPKLEWDAIGEHEYETGVKNGVLYVQSTEEATKGTYPAGVVWNGLTSVSESPEGAEANDMYADDQKYLSIRGAEDHKGSINAYTYPDEFGQCNGEETIATGLIASQQNRKTFGMTYKTTKGNDVSQNDFGYKIHMLYGATVSPSEREYTTINDSPEAIEFSWEYETIPVNVPGKKASALLTLDSTKFTAANIGKLHLVEAVLYGADEFSATGTYAVGDVVEYEDALYVCNTAITTPAAWDESKWDEAENVTVGPRLPLPAELISLLAETA